MKTSQPQEAPKSTTSNRQLSPVALGTVARSDANEGLTHLTHGLDLDGKYDWFFLARDAPPL